MSAFMKHCRVIRSSAVHIGQHVRIVDMNGCMAHIRGKVRNGTVVAIKAKKVYGDTELRPWATIQFDEPEFPLTAERCAELRNWWPNEDDNVLEYRQ